MSLSLFIAKRIFQNKGDNNGVSRPVMRIATLGIAIGIAVMIITVAVVFGFKNTICDKVVGFGGHIQVLNFKSVQSADAHPIYVDDSLTAVMNNIEGIAHTERYAFTQGILKTDEDFLGISFKGIAQEYDTTFLHSNLIAGAIPHFSDSVSSNKLLLSKSSANKLKLDVGDKVNAYFITDNVRARRFTVAGIYQTNMSQFDDAVCFTDLSTVVKLNKWRSGECNGMELRVEDYNSLDEISASVVKVVNRTEDKNGNIIVSQKIQETYPQVFTWLELLDINVWIILVLMVCVAGVTMISGLLIIILERTQMIGVMKALGSTNTSIRNIFLWFSTFVIVRGLIIGNILGIGLVLLQMYTGFVKLDPQTYYVSTAPMELNLPWILVLNIATLLICILVLIVPSYLISHVRPAKSMYYE